MTYSFQRAGAIYASRTRYRSLGRGGFSPSSVAGLWLRLDQRTDTGTLIIPDVVGGTHAQQANATNKPSFSTSNGYPTMTFDGVNSNLRVILTSALAQAGLQWIAFWRKLESTPPNDRYYIGRWVGTAERLTLAEGVTTSWVRCRQSGSEIQRADHTNISGREGWEFVYWGFNGSLASANRLDAQKDGVSQTLSETNDAGTDEIPNSLAVPTVDGTNSLAFCAFTVDESGGTPVRPLNVTIGANVYAGGTVLPSASQLANLRTFEPPVAL